MAFLGVETSLTGRAWIGPGADTMRAVEALAQTTDLPPAICQILARSRVSAADADAYLAPTLRDLMPDPRSLRDMETAAARVLAAVTKRQRIAIFADYDVDGGASAALLLTWFRHFQIAATLYVPDRIDEGYGPNEAAMAQLAAAHDLIICVDCGTLSHGPIDAAVGADVVVLDHHLGSETLPRAAAVVNPNRQDENGSLAHLCAAAVVFLLLVETGRQLRSAGKTEPDLMAFLDLVALATTELGQLGHREGQQVTLAGRRHHPVTLTRRHPGRRKHHTVNRRLEDHFTGPIAGQQVTVLHDESVSVITGHQP